MPYRHNFLVGIKDSFTLFSLPGQGPGRAVVLPPVSALASAFASASAAALANVKVLR